VTAFHDNDATQTHQVLTIGSKVGKYEIVEWIGAGGMGKVYLAIDSTNESKVAIKSINPEYYDRTYLDKEIAALARLNHEHVVGFIESFEQDEMIHIVTDYVEGKTLSSCLKNRELDNESIRRYVLQILDALGYIHEMGIIHSDLKPANIMIDTSHNVKLIDFGIIRTVSAEIAADIKEIRGTPHYMSPEQAERVPYDIRSDLFSLGIILYELYTARKPFGGENNRAVLISIAYEDPIPPDKLSQSIPLRVAALIMRLLQKKPSDRPASAHEVKQRFTAAFDESLDLPTSRNRLAILPFKYPDEDEKSKRLAQGLNNELYMSLQSIKDLDIISPTKIETIVDKLTDSLAIRTELGADYYLRGTISRHEDRVRIYITLVSPIEEKTVWSERFDSPIKNLFDIMDAITEKVLLELKVYFIPKSPVPPPNPDAFELYLLARSYLVKVNKKDLAYAKDIFNQALKIDPDYSLAYVGLADCYCVQYVNYYDRSEANIAGAITRAERALELTPHLPEAYRSLGRIMQAVGKLEEARSYFEKAVIYKDDYYQAYRSLGWLSVDSYRYDDALKWVRKSMSIKSVDIETILLKGIIHLDRKESALAIESFVRCVDLRPDYGRSLFFAGMAYFQLGRINEAIAKLERAMELGGDINTPQLLGYYHLAKGDFAEASQVLRIATKRQEIAFLAEFYLGLSELLGGQKEMAEEQFRISGQHCRELINEDGSFLAAKTTLGKVLALLDEREGCQSLIDELRHFASFDGTFALELAHIYAILGDKNEAERYIKHAADTVRGPTHLELEADPLLRYFHR
jgi:serine/threonine protein kinase/Flp pilus assembly protein TadD